MTGEMEGSCILGVMDFMEQWGKDLVTQQLCNHPTK